MDFIIFVGRVYLQLAIGFFLLFSLIMLYAYEHRREGWFYTIVGSAMLAAAWPFSVLEIFQFFDRAKRRRKRWPMK